MEESSTRQYKHIQEKEEIRNNILPPKDNLLRKAPKAAKLPRVSPRKPPRAPWAPPKPPRERRILRLLPWRLLLRQRQEAPLQQRSGLKIYFVFPLKAPPYYVKKPLSLSAMKDSSALIRCLFFRLTISDSDLLQGQTEEFLCERAYFSLKDFCPSQEPQSLAANL